MLALKTHIGILLLLVMWFNLIQYFVEEFEEYNHIIATKASVVLFFIIEAFMWIIYLCFII